jgi:GLPGLI family protein
MKHLSFLIFFVFSVFSVFNAQNNFVLYSKITDVTGGLSGVNEKQALVFDNNYSYYFYSNANNITNLLADKEPIRSSQFLFYDYSTKTLKIQDKSFTKERLFTMDSNSDFNWQIQKKEKQKILNYTCYKAIGKFRGRNYIAWFAPDIPVEIGPWKFRGLPGLILKVSDTNNFFSFEATQIMLNAKDDFNVMKKLNFEFPTNSIEYLKYEVYFEKENYYLADMRAKILSSRQMTNVNASMSDNREYKIEKQLTN